MRMEGNLEEYGLEIDLGQEGAGGDEGDGILNGDVARREVS
jgi:hypothetical protein